MLIPTAFSVLLITLKLSDDSGAFTYYNFNVEFQNNTTYTFNHINNINVDASISTQIYLNAGLSNISSHLWKTHRPIDWIWYSGAQNTLYIYNQTKWGFNFGKNNA